MGDHHSELLILSVQPVCRGKMPYKGVSLRCRRHVVAMGCARAQWVWHRPLYWSPGAREGTREL